MQKKANKNISYPKNPILSPFHIELDKTPRGLSLSVSGVKGISEYSDTNVRLKLVPFSLDICGSGLLMTVFEGRRVEIIGKISEVRFIYAKI